MIIDQGFAVTYLNSIVNTCAVTLFSTLISSSVQMLIVGVLVTPIINKTCEWILICLLSYLICLAVLWIFVQSVNYRDRITEDFIDLSFLHY